MTGPDDEIIAALRSSPGDPPPSDVYARVATGVRRRRRRHIALSSAGVAACMVAALAVTPVLLRGHGSTPAPPSGTPSGPLQSVAAPPMCASTLDAQPIDAPGPSGSGLVPGAPSSAALCEYDQIDQPHPLKRYVLPSIAIGLLSPGSALVARAAVGEALSWHDAGVMQALWRLSDWVSSFAAGILSFYFLPQLAAAGQGERFRAVLRRAAKTTLIPAAVVFGAFCLLQTPLLGILYSDEFRATDLTAALIFIGGWVRIASWVSLFGLYAQRRTTALTVGEFLSLPLFAVLVLAAGGRLTLEMVGVFWLLSYCAYLAFNWWAVRRS